jgi:hypothetical protein
MKESDQLLAELKRQVEALHALKRHTINQVMLVMVVVFLCGVIVGLELAGLR